MSQALVKTAAGWLLGLMLAVAGAVVSVNLVNNSVASPQQPVRDYLEALQKGEGDLMLYEQPLYVEYGVRIRERRHCVIHSRFSSARNSNVPPNRGHFLQASECWVYG